MSTRNQERIVFGAIIIVLFYFLSISYQSYYIASTTALLRAQEAAAVVPADSVPSTQQQDANDCLSHLETVKGYGIYSQNDEDGAILQVLRCMGGHGKKEYFEFGSEDGTEVNTRTLRDMYGWKGHLLDGGNENPKIPLHKEWFTPSNIVSLLEKYNVSKDVDVLSVDTDYDDFWTTREILLAGYRPRVLINEYNINFATSWSVSTVAKPIGQEANIYWGKGGATCYFGASGLAMVSLAKAFGYTPVWHNFANIIFVQLDQAKKLNMIIPSSDNFPGPYAMPLHPPCSGKTWTLIDPSIVESKAADAGISHTEFANSFSKVALKHKDFTRPGRDTWRIFYEA